MKVEAQFVGGRTFLARGESSHAVAFDTSKEAGGHGSAPGPMEMVLMSLSTCSGIDVVMILEKRRVDLQDLSIDATGERAAKPPRVYTDIHLTYTFTSPDLTEKDAERAIKLSREKYCSVSKMLESTATITVEFEILRPE